MAALVELVYLGLKYVWLESSMYPRCGPSIKAGREKRRIGGNERAKIRAELDKVHFQVGATKNNFFCF